MAIRCVGVALAAVCVLLPAAAAAEKCPGNPDALGTARVLMVDPAEHARIGAMQYDETLPLAPKEVVLTFDDGPLPQYTARILEALAAECVKATFFMVGRMARAYPEWVRRVYNAGHTVGTHTNRHPRAFDTFEAERAVAEIEDGIAAAEAALGDRRALAPFFRFPGLRTSSAAERYLAGRGIMTWSADVASDDWRRITAGQVVARSLARLESRGRGVLLMHDIQARTALALPDLLRELKARGYRIVHVVPSGPDRPKTVTEPAVWAARSGRPSIWPVALAARPAAPPALPAPSAMSFGFPDVFSPTLEVGPIEAGPSMRIARADLPRPGERADGEKPPWPAVAVASTPPEPLEWASSVYTPERTAAGKPRRERRTVLARAGASQSEWRLRGRIEEDWLDSRGESEGRRRPVRRQRHEPDERWPSLFD